MGGELQSFPSPAQCALAGYPASAGARVAASEEKRDQAVVLVVTTPPEHPYLVLCVRDDGGWTEATASTGRLQWALTHADSERGVLFAWGRSLSGRVRVRVGARWIEPAAIAEDGYWVILTEDVLEGEIDHVNVVE